MTSKRRGRTVARFEQWVTEQPEWLRPPIYGATLVVTMFGSRLLWALPFLVYFIWRDGLEQAVFLPLIVAMLAVAGACAGFAYSLIGVHLRHRGRLGAYIAGMVCVGGYLLPMLLMVGKVDTRYAFDPRDTADQLFAIIATVAFGALFGHSAFFNGKQTGFFRREPGAITEILERIGRKGQSGLMLLPMLSAVAIEVYGPAGWALLVVSSALASVWLAWARPAEELRISDHFIQMSPVYATLALLMIGAVA